MIRRRLMLLPPSLFALAIVLTGGSMFRDARRAPDTPVVGLDSGGVGLTRAEWQRRHGRPTQEDAITARYHQAYVTFTPITSVQYQHGLVMGIGQWPIGSPAASDDEGRLAAERLLPTDAVLVRTTREPSSHPRQQGTLITTHRYESQSLAERFAEARLAGRNPKVPAGGAVIVTWQTPEGRGPRTVGITAMPDSTAARLRN